jgi:hypothetical protein
LGQSKTRKLWDLSARDLELYLYASTRPEPRSERDVARQLSEITGHKYHRSQVVNSSDRLRRMGLMKDDFSLTEKGVDDLLDRLTRFAGRAGYDPAIRQTTDLGDDQRYFDVLLHGAKVALKGTPQGRRKLDERSIITTDIQILRKLRSKESVPQLSQEQREKIAMLLETSNEMILRGLADEQRHQKRRREATHSHRHSQQAQSKTSQTSLAR